MKKNLLLFCLFFAVAPLFAQWQTFTLPLDPVEDLYGIGVVSGDVFVVSSNSQIARTANGGQSWQVTDLNANFPAGPFLAIAVLDLHFYDANQGIGTGAFNIFNDELVIRTTDGGASWGVSYVNSPAFPPVLFNALDVRGAQVLAAGTQGHIIRSVDQGASFSTVNYTAGLELLDVKFTGANRALAFGADAVLQSGNGGLTWSVHPAFDGEFPQAIAVTPDGLTYLLTNSGLHRSDDAGLTFAAPVPLPFLSFDASLAATHDTVFVAAGTGVFLSTDAGAHWQKLPTNQGKPINRLALAGGRLYALCDDATLLVLDVASMQPVPLSSFSVAGGLEPYYCTGATVSLENQSVPGASYTWLLGGDVLSTAYDTAVTITGAGNNIVALIVANANGADTSYATLYGFGVPEVAPFVVTASHDTVCDGVAVKFTLSLTEYDTEYQLYNGAAPLGNAVHGNPNQALVFTAPPASGTMPFRIVAIRTNACYADTLDVPRPIVSATLPASTPFYLSRDTACYYDSVWLVVPDSRPGYRYTWHNYTHNISGTQYVQGTGDTLRVPLPLWSTPQVVAPRAVSIAFGCARVLSPGRLLTVQRPAPYFSLNTFNPEVGEAIYTINRSDNPAGVFRWDFGPGAVPQLSVDPAPAGIICATPGTYTVKLVTTTPYGCVDSVERSIHVLDPFATEACRYARVSSTLPNGVPQALVKDDQDNTIFWYNAEATTHQLVLGQQGDSIITDVDYNLAYPYSHFLTKFNPKGISQWTVRLWHGSVWARQGDVATDAAGNIYCTYSHGEYLDSLRIYSSDGRFITIKPSSGGIPEVIVMKFDKDGILQWYGKSPGVVSLDRLALRADAEGNLYVADPIGLYKYDSAGQLLWVNNLSHADVDLDTAGYVWTCGYYGNAVRKFDPTSGELLAEFQPTTNVFLEYIKIDDRNNLYLAGNLFDTLYFASQAFPLYPGVSGHTDGFVLKMKPDGRQEWARTFGSRQPIVVKGIDIRENDVVLFATGFDTVFTASLAPLPITRGHFLYHCDTLGGSEAIARLYQTPALYVNSTQSSLVNFASGSSDLALAFEFSGGFGFAGDSILPFQMSMYLTSNMFIAEGSSDCFLPPIPVQQIPYTYFLPVAPGPYCEGVPVTLQDLSSNNPTQWQWSFPGGTPASSTEQHPTVSYATPGLYPVTLVATNDFGAGAVLERRIRIQPLLTIDLQSDTADIPGYLTLTVATNDPAATFQWQDSTAAHDWQAMGGEIASILYVPLDSTTDGNRYRCVVSSDGYCGPYLSAIVQVGQVSSGAAVPDLPELRVFPNPYAGSFQVELPTRSGTSFYLIDVLGRTVHEQLTLPGRTLHTVEAGALPAGIYRLVAVCDGRVVAAAQVGKY